MMYNDFLDNNIPIFGLNKLLADGSCGCGIEDCKNAGKHPVSRGWQHSPVWDEEQLLVMEESGQLSTGYGVLVSCGLLVIDIDARNGGVESFERLASLCPEIGGCEFVVNTGSGNGSRHLYFYAPTGVPLLQQLNDYPGIDFKSTGFVVGPGSAHKSGNKYEVVIGSPSSISDAPQSLIDLLKRPEKHRSTVDGIITDISDDELRDLVSAIPNDDESYEVFISVGMGIHEVTKGEGFDLWDSWARKSTKYDSKEMDYKWRSFGKSANPVTLGTLKYYAQKAGWVEPVTFVPSEEWSTPAEIDDLLDVSDIDLGSPPGFVGELTNWIDKRNRHRRRNLAVASALSVVSSVAGMRFIDPLDGITPNLFVFGVAASATGKESILKSTQELMREAGISAAVHGGIKSEQEIYRNLIRNQAAIYLVDEMGEQLTKIQNARKKGTSAYLEGVIGTLLSAYSKADSHLLITGDLKEEIKKSIQAEIAMLKRDGAEDSSDKRLRERYESALDQLNSAENGIENPYLVIFGLTTPEKFDLLMDYDMAANGFMGRSLIFREFNDNPRARKRDEIISKEVPQSIKFGLMGLYQGGHSEAPKRVQRVGDLVPIATTDDAADLLDRIVEYFEDMAEQAGDRGMTAIPRRGYEQVAKLSMILAIPSRLRTIEHVRWAFALAKRDVLEKSRLAFSNSAVDKTDKIVSKVLSMITKDHGITTGVLKNKCRGFRAEEVEKCADYLVDKGILRVEEISSARTGKTKKYYLK